MIADHTFEITASAPAELPPTPLQQAMLRHARKSHSDGLNVMQSIVTFREPLQPLALQTAWDAVISSRDALRMFFPADTESPVVSDFVTHPWRVEDLRPVVPAELERLEAFLEEDRAEGFHLEHAPLSRVSLFQIGATEWRMVWTFHHIILDGRSAAMILRDVLQAYRTLVEGRPLEQSYAPEFSAFLQTRPTADSAEDEAFWKQELSGISRGTSLEIPLALAAPTGLRAGRVAKDTTARLKEMAALYGCSLGSIVHAAWALVLARHANSEDVVFGEVRSCRPPEARDVVGMCVNTVPLRISVRPDQSVAQWLRGIREKRIQIRNHENASLADIQQWTGVDQLIRSVVMFDHSTFDAAVRSGMDGAASRRFELRSDTGMPLTLWVHGGDEITFRIQARPYVPVAALALIVRRFSAALQSIANSTPSAVISDLSVADDHEQKQIEAWSTGPTTEPVQRTLDSLFTAQLESGGESPAVVWSGGSLTYNQLHRRALSLASRIPVGRLVAVVMEKGWEQIVAVLAIHYAGCAYVPVDASVPALRRNAVLEKADVRTALVQPGTPREDWPESVEAICVDDTETDGSAPARSKPGELAYVIFTSGSTGEPKGVMIDHRSAVNTCLDVNRRHQITAEDRILGISSLSFDLSVWDIWGTFAAGATLVIPDAESLREPAHWADLVQNERITVWNSVPALLRIYIEFLEAHPGRISPDLRAAFLSGDWIPLDLPSHVGRLMPNATVTSMGGATEGSIWSIDYTVEKVEPHWRSIPYGRPMVNQNIYILSPQLQPCESHVVGQIYIGGAGVALGYWSDPVRTAESFIAHPKTGERLYRTGDLGRWLRDGLVEFLGREDFQVKVQGFRIELEEIEATLLRHPEVDSAAVVARGSRDGEKRIAAYIVPRGGFPTAGSELRSYICKRLPSYMVPGSFTVLPSLPLNQNGKLDRNALPEPEVARTTAVPLDPLASLVTSILQHEGIDDQTNLLHLGVSSMEMIRLASAVEKQFGVRPKLSELYQNPTVEFIRGLIPESGSPVPPLPEIAPPEFSGDLPMSDGQRALWLLEQMVPDVTAYNIPMAWRVSGELSIAGLRLAMANLITRHPALRAAFRGTSHTGGTQTIQPSEAIELSPIWSSEDLSSIPEDQREQAVAERFHSEQSKRFDLAQPPLMRVCLLKLAPAEHVVFWTFHHIISDAHSLALLFGEFKELYQAALDGAAAQLPAPGDYAAAMQRTTTPDITWWRNYLEGAPASVPLSTDRPRPSAFQFRGGTVEFEIPVETVQAALGLARHCAATLYPVLFAAFAGVLGRCSAAEDLVIGTATRNREFPNSEHVAGFFTEVLPTRIRLTDEPSFINLVEDAHRSIGDTLAHENTPMQALIDGLNPVADPSRNPFFQHLFVFVTEPPSETLKLGKCTTTPLRFPGITSKFDLTLFLTLQSDGGIRGTLEYCTALFEKVTAQRIAARFVAFLADGLAEPASPIHEARIMGDSEVADISVWSRTKQLRLLDKYGFDVPVGVIGRIHDSEGAHGDARWCADGALEIIVREEMSKPAEPEGEFIASQNLLQTQLIEIWESVLEKRPIGIRDHFFQIGGRSMSAVRMLAQVAEKLGRKIEPGQFFEKPTIEALSILLRSQSGSGEPWMRLNTEGKRDPLVFLHGDFCGGFYTRQLAEDLGNNQPVIAVHPHGTTGGAMPASIREMAEDRLAALKKAGITGPIVLGGYCNGAFVALEMARQIEKAGGKPPLVIMVMADGSNLRFRGTNQLIRTISFGSDEATKEQRFLRMRNQISFLSAAAKKFSALPIGEKVKRLSKKIVGGKTPESAAVTTPQQEPAEPDQFGGLASIYIRAIEAYAPSDYGGKIVCLWPKDEPGEWHAKDPTRGWDNVAAEVDGFMVPGDHFSVISNPENLSTVAVRIREILGL